MKWNPEQELAIQLGGEGEILVSAAAGSGKTAVLTERLVERCLKGDVEPESIAVMTFTEKAAAHMREKMEEKITERLQKLKQPSEASQKGLSILSDLSGQKETDPPAELEPRRTLEAEREKLRQLQESLPLMQISTIHAFCRRIIHDYASYLTLFDEKGHPQKLQPDFSILDSQEVSILEQKALDRLLREIYVAIDDYLGEETELLGRKGERIQVKKRTEEKDGIPDSSFPIFQRLRRTQTQQEQKQNQKLEQNQSAQDGGEGEPHLVGLLYPAASGKEWLQDWERMALWYGGKNPEKVLRELLVDTRRLLRSLPDYETFCLKAVADLASEASDFAASQTAHESLLKLKPYVDQAWEAIPTLEELPYFSLLMAESKKLTKEKEAFQTYYPLLKQTIEQLRSALQLEDLSAEKIKEIWSLAHETGLRFLDWKPLTSSSKDQDKMDFRDVFYPQCGPLIQILSGCFDSATAVAKDYQLDQLTNDFYLSIAEIEEGTQRAVPMAARFLETVLLLDQRLSQLKLEKNGVDYDDLEHLALQVARTPQVGEALSSRYQEIYVDEYQDTSPLQEALIQAIRPKLCFQVGDVKQSIYRFRHADPTLFMRKQTDYAPLGGAGEKERPEEFEQTRTHRCVFLGRNYRTDSRLIEWINGLFRGFLTRESGEIDYDERQELVPGEKEQGTEKGEPSGESAPAVGFDFIYTDEAKDLLPLASEMKKEASEARLDLPSESQENGAIPSGLTEDKDILLETDIGSLSALQSLLMLRQEGFRWRNIAILCRTNQIVSRCCDLLNQLGIPAVSSVSAQSFDTRDLRLLDHLIQLLNNFRQDIPLVAVLRSSLIDAPFREAELLKIAQQPVSEKEREQDGGENFFYRRFLLYSQKGSEEALCSRCREWLEKLNQWRYRATWLSLSDLLRELVESSGWIDQLSLQENGERRLRDWDLFLSWAQEYEKKPGADLAGFAQVLQAYQQQKLEMTGFSEAPEDPQAVRVMTVHASKGLEFPAVIYLEASHPVRETIPGKQPPQIYLDGDSGLAVTLPFDQLSLRPPRLNHWKEQKRFKERAEEFRLLYVALTRAQYRCLVMASSRQTSLKNLVQEMVQSRTRWEESPQGHPKRRLNAAFVDQTQTVYTLMNDWLAGQIHQWDEKLENQLSWMSEVSSGDLSSEASTEASTEASAETSAGAPSLGADSSEAIKARMNWEIRPSAEELGKALLPPILTLHYQTMPYLMETLPSQLESLRQLEEGALFTGGESPEERIDFTDRLRPYFAFNSADDPLFRAPSKITVTEFQKQWRQVDPLEQSGQNLDQDSSLSGGSGAALSEGSTLKGLRNMGLILREPQMEPSTGQLRLSGSAQGTFLHRLFCLLPLSLRQEAIRNEDSWDKAYQQWVEEAIQAGLWVRQEESLLMEAEPWIRAFLVSPLAEEMQQAEAEGRPVWRERPFIFSRPAIGVPQPQGAQTMIQGTIDLFFKRADGSWLLVDYKSDQLKEKGEALQKQLIERYQVQLSLYAEAIRRLNPGEKTPLSAGLWLIREGTFVPVAILADLDDSMM